MRALFFALLSSVLFMLPTVSSAQQRDITIDLGDRVYQGQSTLHIRQLIERQYPRINLDNWNLLKVRLVAKSRHGQGQAKLVVGQWQSPSQNIGGRPVDWNWDQPQSFDRMDFYNRVRRDDNKRWQIHMHGNIKVRKLVITGERERSHGGSVKVDTCSSQDHRYRECIQPSRIISANLVSKHSDSSCRKNRDWGYRGRVLWVDNGCRGTFRLRLQ